MVTETPAFFKNCLKNWILQGWIEEPVQKALEEKAETFPLLKALLQKRTLLSPPQSKKEGKDEISHSAGEEEEVKRKSQKYFVCLQHLIRFIHECNSDMALVDAKKQLKTFHYFPRFSQVADPKSHSFNFTLKLLLDILYGQTNFSYYRYWVDLGDGKQVPLTNLKDESNRILVKRLIFNYEHAAFKLKNNSKVSEEAWKWKPKMLNANFYTANIVYEVANNGAHETDDLFNDDNPAVRALGDRYVFAIDPGENEQMVTHSLARFFDGGNFKRQLKHIF
jgi:hypothetical protein